MLVVATAGHVDHGKSTLVHALTGMTTDRLRTEQERGLTQDLGFAWFRGSPDVALVDVPGHEKYLSTTLAGLGPSPAALFVVAADQGWQEQSSEHLAALAGLGTTGRRVVLAVTRTDLVGSRAAHVVRDAAIARVGAALGAPSAAVLVAARQGTGVESVRDALRALPSTAAADTSSGARLWVDRTFTVRGAGTVVTGTVQDGALRLEKGTRLTLRQIGVRRRGPVERVVTVRGLHSLGREVGSVDSPGRIALSIRGLEPAQWRRGDLLTADPTDRPCRRWDVEELDLDAVLADAGAAPARARKPHPQVQVHVGTATSPGRLVRRERGATLVLRDGVAARPGDHASLRSVGTGRLIGAVRLLSRDDEARAAQPSPPRSMSARDLALLSPILARLRADPFDAPPALDVRSLPGRADLLARAESHGLVLRLAADLLVGPDAPSAAIGRLTDLGQPFTVAEARAALGSSRRVVVPLLEHLATRGLTTRLDAVRHTVGQSVRKPRD